MTAMAVASERHLMAGVGRWLGAHVAGIVTLGVLIIAALFAAPFVLAHALTGTSTDWFDISAIRAIVCGFGMAMSIPWRSERVLAQLADRKVLQFSSGEKLDSVPHTLRTRAARSMQRGSFIGGVAILSPMRLPQL